MPKVLVFDCFLAKALAEGVKFRGGREQAPLALFPGAYFWFVVMHVFVLRLWGCRMLRTQHVLVALLSWPGSAQLNAAILVSLLSPIPLAPPTSDPTTFATGDSSASKLHTGLCIAACKQRSNTAWTVSLDSIKG